MHATAGSGDRFQVLCRSRSAHFRPQNSLPDFYEQVRGRHQTPQRVCTLGCVRHGAATAAAAGAICPYPRCNRNQWTYIWRLGSISLQGRRASGLLACCMADVQSCCATAKSRGGRDFSFCMHAFYVSNDGRSREAGSKKVGEGGCMGHGVWVPHGPMQGHWRTRHLF